jgi:hypothetical protein
LSTEKPLRIFKKICVKPRSPQKPVPTDDTFRVKQLTAKKPSLTEDKSRVKPLPPKQPLENGIITGDPSLFLQALSFTVPPKFRIPKKAAATTSRTDDAVPAGLSSSSSCFERPRTPPLTKEPDAKGVGEGKRGRKTEEPVQQKTPTVSKFRIPNKAAATATAASTDGAVPNGQSSPSFCFKRPKTPPPLTKWPEAKGTCEEERGTEAEEPVQQKPPPIVHDDDDMDVLDITIEADDLGLP